MTYQYAERQLDLESQQARQRLQAQERMTQVMQRFATLVVGRPIGVRLSQNTLAPAWSTSNTIQFSQSELPDLSTLGGALVTRGLTWHELSHILFTPRSQSDIVRWAQTNGYGMSFNALEDQRIELLTCTKYPSVTPWLVSLIGHYIIEADDASVDSFSILYGRKYLPLEVRQAFATAYSNQQDIPELMAIIDEYLKLTFPSDTERAKVLIQRYHELTQNTQRPDPHGHGDTCDNWQSAGPSSRPVSEKKQRGIGENIEDEQFDWSEPQPETSGASQAESTDNGADGGNSSDNSGDVSDSVSDTNTDSVSADTSANTTTATDATTSSDSSHGTNPTGKSLVDALQAMQDSMDSARDSLTEQLREDVQKFKGEVSLDGRDVPAPSPVPMPRSELPAPSAVKASVQFKQELLRIKAEHDPAWNYRVRKGRLNAKRYSLGGRIDEVFDKFEQGRDDATDIEAVILLDTSGSMDEIRTEAYNSMWAIKRALDGINANATVLTFDSQSHTLYTANERATSVMKYSSTSGGTNPSHAIKYAQSVFANSDRAIKMLYVITDGAWGGYGDPESASPDKVIADLSNAGVLTTLAYITTYSEPDLSAVNAHNCSAVALLRDPADLIQIGRAVVKQAIHRNLSVA